MKIRSLIVSTMFVAVALLGYLAAPTVAASPAGPFTAVQAGGAGPGSDVGVDPYLNGADVSTSTSRSCAGSPCIGNCRDSSCECSCVVCNGKLVCRG